MLYARLFTLVLLFRGQAAYIHDFMAYEQLWEQDGSGMDGSGMEGSGLNIKEWPSFDDPSQTCDGSSDQVINITFTDTTGCFRFQTPGFDAGGYPNSTNRAPARNDYFCEYVLLLSSGLRFQGLSYSSPLSFQFGDNNVTGTVTVFKEGFHFEASFSGCYDFFAFGIAVEISDPENVVCGILSEDIEQTFDSNSFTLGFRADNSLSYNGADVRLCFD